VALNKRSQCLPENSRVILNKLPPSLPVEKMVANREQRPRDGDSSMLAMKKVISCPPEELRVVLKDCSPCPTKEPMLALKNKPPSSRE
jgi:hypothetical protein